MYIALPDFFIPVIIKLLVVIKEKARCLFLLIDVLKENFYVSVLKYSKLELFNKFLSF